MDTQRQSFILNVLRGISLRANRIFSGKSKQTGLSWLRKKQLKHLPYGKPGKYPFKGSSLHFNNGPELLHSLEEIFADDIYNIQFKTRTPLILDCGANIGLSVLYLKIKYPEARIIAFEPDATNFQTLEKNVNNFNLTGVELRNEAVWKESTTLEFLSDGTLGSKLSAAGSPQNVIRVKATRLKDFLSQPVDFLKMDIEGAEYEVLKDCADSLNNVDNLFIEFHGYFEKTNQLTEILSLVEQNGFAYYIKEASNVYATPFSRDDRKRDYDLQLNIFCFRLKSEK